MHCNILCLAIILFTLIAVVQPLQVHTSNIENAFLKWETKYAKKYANRAE